MSKTGITKSVLQFNIGQAIEQDSKAGNHILYNDELTKIAVFIAEKDKQIKELEAEIKRLTAISFKP